MAKVNLKKVCKVYPGNVKAVNDVDLEIKDKEFVVLVGPSGCGKSTTLRMIAGLEEISEGDLFIGDRLVNDVPPKDRNIAMVFQNYALYPHMSVYENLAFGLKLRKYPKNQIDARVREAASILDIKELLDRKPKALSGGQRQRVALGRAIVRKPEVFLFDEPLSNLDAKLRGQMRIEINKLHTRLQATMVYVTHDQVEAMTMGERIVVMKDGFIQQVADPISLYNHPVNKFVAGFIGSPPMNFLEVEVKQEGESFWLDEGKFKIRLPQVYSEKIKPFAGHKVTLGIRPEDMFDKLYYSGPKEDNVVKVTVEVKEPLGSELLLYTTTGKHQITCKVESSDKAEVNQDIEMVFDMAKIHLFETDSSIHRAIF
jgi:multiple sugar transport system ATP-binding protein